MYFMQRKNKKDASKHPNEMQVKYWKNKKSEKLVMLIYINMQFFFIES